MPIWNKDLQQWGYMYFEELPHSTWLGLSREVYPTMERQAIENSFTYHAPKGTQQERYVALRDKAKELAHLINESVSPSAEQTLAIRKLEEAIMWANKGIACNE